MIKHEHLTALFEASNDVINIMALPDKETALELIAKHANRTRMYQLKYVIGFDIYILKDSEWIIKDDKIVVEKELVLLYESNRFVLRMMQGLIKSQTIQYIEKFGTDDKSEKLEEWIEYIEEQLKV